jgi:hypothetical protein
MTFYVLDEAVLVYGMFIDEIQLHFWFFLVWNVSWSVAWNCILKINVSTVFQKGSNCYIIFRLFYMGVELGPVML